MNGDRLLIDTNIALYLLSGNDTITEMLEGKQVCISFISELELLSYSGITVKEKQIIKQFLNDCFIVNMPSGLKPKVIEFRRNYQMKLPDSIIAATSLYLNIPFFTADKAFRKANILNLYLFEEK